MLDNVDNATVYANNRRRPAPNVDGTVHESSSDVLVRVRQLLSLLETQYTSDAVVIISPDRWVDGVRWGGAGEASAHLGPAAKVAQAHSSACNRLLLPSEGPGKQFACLSDRALPWHPSSTHAATI